MDNDPDCPDSFTVVGGSALTKIVEDPSNPLAEHDGVDLYYAAFASRRVAFTESTREFLQLYEERYGPDISGTDVSDAALTFDSFNALQETANYALRSNFDAEADRSAQALIGGEVRLDGASGYIALGNDPLGGDFPRVPPDKPVLVVRAEDAEVVLACGTFAMDEVRHTWGPDGRQCPTVD